MITVTGDAWAGGGRLQLGDDVIVIEPNESAASIQRKVNESMLRWRAETWGRGYSCLEVVHVGQTTESDLIVRRALARATGGGF